MFRFSLSVLCENLRSHTAGFLMVNLADFFFDMGTIGVWVGFRVKVSGPNIYDQLFRSVWIERPGGVTEVCHGGVSSVWAGRFVLFVKTTRCTC